MGAFISNSQQEEDIANDEALLHACEYGDEDALAVLLRDTIANVNHVDREQEGTTPLIAAAMEGHAGCLRRMIATGNARVDFPDWNGQTPLHAAAHWDRAEVVDVLCAAGADTTARDRSGATLAHLAATKDNVAALRALLVAHKARVDAPNGEGQTVYDVAAAHNAHDCVALLDTLDDMTTVGHQI